MIRLARIDLRGDGNMTELANIYDKVVVPVRSIGNEYRQKQILCARNVYHVSALSPSAALFSEFCNISSKLPKEQFPEQWFRDVYIPRFLQQMCGEEERRLLNAIYSDGAYHEIAIVCFCKNEWNCHRSILMGLYQGADKRFDRHIADCSTDYSAYYDMYQKYRKGELQ